MTSGRETVTMANVDERSSEELGQRSGKSVVSKTEHELEDTDEPE